MHKKANEHVKKKCFPIPFVLICLRKLLYNYANIQAYIENIHLFLKNFIHHAMLLPGVLSSLHKQDTRFRQQSSAP